MAAVVHPRPEVCMVPAFLHPPTSHLVAQGYVFTERDWDHHNHPVGEYGDDLIPKVRDVAYAKAKARCERYLYAVSYTHLTLPTKA